MAINMNISSNGTYGAAPHDSVSISNMVYSMLGIVVFILLFAITVTLYEHWSPAFLEARESRKEGGFHPKRYRMAGLAIITAVVAVINIFVWLYTMNSIIGTLDHLSSVENATACSIWKICVFFLALAGACFIILDVLVVVQNIKLLLDFSRNDQSSKHQYKAASADVEARITAMEEELADMGEGIHATWLRSTTRSTAPSPPEDAVYSSRLPRLALKLLPRLNTAVVKNLSFTSPVLSQDRRHRPFVAERMISPISLGSPVSSVMPNSAVSSRFSSFSSERSRQGRPNLRVALLPGIDPASPLSSSASGGPGLGTTIFTPKSSPEASTHKPSSSCISSSESPSPTGPLYEDPNSDHDGLYKVSPPPVRPQTNYDPHWSD